jgi:hypothetical protein
MKTAQVTTFLRVVLVSGFSMLLAWGNGFDNQLEADWLKDFSSVQNQIVKKNSLAKSAAGALDENDVMDKQALIWPDDRTPLDVQFRRTKACQKIAIL